MPTGPLPAQQFTGQERDGLESQDYFGAPYYRPRHGRFSQVDPVYAGLFDPQQWNRYAYARNNPLSFVDPDGRCVSTTNVGMTARVEGPGMVMPPTVSCTGGGGTAMPGTGAYFGVPPSLVNGGPAGPPPGPRRERGGGAQTVTSEDHDGLVPLVNETTGEVKWMTEEALVVETAKVLALAIGLAVAPFVAEALMVAPVATTAVTSGSQVSASAFQHRVSTAISQGHAFGKHVIQGGEFPGINTPAQFASHIRVVMGSPDVRLLADGRQAWWPGPSGTVVIYNPSAADLGTAFVPRQGLAYFRGLR